MAVACMLFVASRSYTEAAGAAVLGGRAEPSPRNSWIPTSLCGWVLALVELDLVLLKRIAIKSVPLPWLSRASILHTDCLCVLCPEMKQRRALARSQRLCSGPLQPPESCTGTCLCSVWITSPRHSVRAEKVEQDRVSVLSCVLATWISTLAMCLLKSAYFSVGLSLIYFLTLVLNFGLCSFFFQFSTFFYFILNQTYLLPMIFF